MTPLAVTGASGYLGGGLCEAIASRDGAAVLAIDVAPPRRAIANVSFRRLDVRDASLASVLREAGVRRLVHLAALHEPSGDRAAQRAVNVEGARRVLEAAAAAGVEQVVLGSGTLVYGAHPDNPARLTEEHPLRGNEDFPPAADGVQMERAAAEFGRGQTHVAVAVARMPFVLGPRATHFFARTLQQPLLFLPSGADPEFQFLHEDDAAAALLKLSEGRFAGAFNVVGEGTMRLSECLARLRARVRRLPRPLLAAAGRLAWALRIPVSEHPPAFLPYLTWPWVADGARAAREIGFAPRHSSAAAFESFLKTFA
jgi:UDP-glucose 4-epimerase